ncbi:MAG: Spy/CpxP family protein refolding chaperone [bacterium]|nr:Spy/CpxP family protein refolding chaperone [bacterium]
MKTRLPIITALILVMAAAAWAQPGRAPRGPGDQAGPDRMLARLDLTETQTAAIAKIRDEARERGRETRKEILRLRHELQGIMMQDTPDAAAAERLVEKMGALRTEQQVRRLQTRLAIRAQLTPEQRDRMPLPGDGPRGRRPAARGATVPTAGAGCVAATTAAGAATGLRGPATATAPMVPAEETTDRT